MTCDNCLLLKHIGYSLKHMYLHAIGFLNRKFEGKILLNSLVTEFREMYFSIFMLDISEINSCRNIKLNFNTYIGTFSVLGPFKYGSSFLRSMKRKHSLIIKYQSNNYIINLRVIFAN